MANLRCQTGGIGVFKDMSILLSHPIFNNVKYIYQTQTFSDPYSVRVIINRDRCNEPLVSIEFTGDKYVTLMTNWRGETERRFFFPIYREGGAIVDETTRKFSEFLSGYLSEFSGQREL